MSTELLENSAPTVADFPEPADLLNQLKARRKKSGANLADMEVVLEILGTDGSEIWAENRTIGNTINLKPLLRKRHTKWARRDLNPRPSGPEPDALSTELRALNFYEYSTSCWK